MKIKRRIGFSVAEPSERAAYLKLNHQTPCPPRSTVPVNTRAWFREFVSPQHARFAFGNDGDHPGYVKGEYEPTRETQSNWD
jgi:hypothetical protein